MTCIDEGTAAQLLAGELAVGDAEAARQHIVSCRDCEQFLAELARVAVEPTSAEHAPLGPGTEVGRYVLRERVGVGGMGVVYLASDPALDRSVALKLLRGDTAEGHARLQREAQTAARLAHPNVVPVFDIGSFEGGVYIAMEYVPGTTLATWLATPRRWQDIVDAFIQCGKGLAAAHAKGIVHRDFKPDNVLVGGDGRLRVADFGLAREATDASPAHAPEPHSAPTVGDGLRLTRTGALLGTPRFMAPEQFTGGAITAATDQFAFCVALYAALYRTPPFHGERVSEIAAQVVAGALAPPRVAPGPARLRRAIVRGLAGDPAHRHPSMDTLVAELERVRALRKKRVIGAAFAIAIAAAGSAFVGLRRDTTTSPCANSASRLASVWNADRAARVRAAVDPDSRAAVDRRLSAYAAAWSSARIDACTATHVDNDQSQQLLDLRVACLDDRLSELGALVGALETADRTAAGKALEAADALPSLAACADRKALVGRVAPPDPGIATRVAELGTQLGQVAALEHLGKVGPALALATTACGSIDTLDYAPALARCRYVVGSLVDQSAGEQARAITLTSEAVDAAIAGNDHERVAEAALALGHLLGDRVGRYEEAERWIGVAESASVRLAERRDLAARIAHTRGVLAARRGDHAQALARFEDELRITDELHPEIGLQSAAAHIAIGHSLLASNRGDEAEAHYRDALLIIEEIAGPDHPALLPVLDGLGNLAFTRQDFGEAVRHLERSLAITRAMVGPHHPSTILAQANLGSALTNAKQLDRAVAELEGARAAVEDGDRRGLALVLSNLVPLYQELGQHEHALVIAEQALAIEREVKGEDHPETAIAHFNVGDVLMSLHRPREAVPRIERALEIWQHTLPPDHPHLALAREVLAKARTRGR